MQPCINIIFLQEIQEVHVGNYDFVNHYFWCAPYIHIRYITTAIFVIEMNADSLIFIKSTLVIKDLFPQNFIAI